MKKLLVLLLAVIMVFTAVACASGEKKPSNGTGVQTTPDGETTPGSTEVPGSHIPDMDFDAADFRISSRTASKEVFVGEESTDICDVAVYNRNLIVEDKYNVALDHIVASDVMGSQVGEIVTMALSDVDYCEIAMPYCMDSTPLIINGVVKNWKNFEYTDLSQPYWINDVNSKFAIKENIYSVVGEMCTSTITMAYAMFYNRTKGEIMKAGLSEELFDVIRDGDWTYDYFYDLVSNVYDDIDEITGASEGDFYGFVAEGVTNTDNYYFAWDLPIVVNDPETGLHLNDFFNEKLVSATDKIIKLYHETAGTYIPKGNMQASLSIKHFAEGKALFNTTMLREAFGAYRNMEDDYTILPYPKYDEDQTKYLTGCMDNYSIIVAPITVKNTDMVSVVVEALNLESWNSVYPTYRDDALKGKYSRDPETIEMLEYVFAGRTFDISFLVSRNVGACYILRKVVRGDYADIKTAWDTLSEKNITQLETIMQKYESWADE